MREHLVPPIASMVGVGVCTLKEVGKGNKIILSKVIIDMLVTGFICHIFWILLPLCNRFNCGIPEEVMLGIYDHQIVYAIFALIGYYHETLSGIFDKTFTSFIKKKTGV